jgi:hypothetical protein
MILSTCSLRSLLLATIRRSLSCLSCEHLPLSSFEAIYYIFICIYLSFSHHPSSPPSTRALALLRAALSGPYPPNKPTSPPLEFDLQVVESAPPTQDQLSIILSYLPHRDSSTPSLSAFISSHPASPPPHLQPYSPAGIVQIATNNPNILKWPIVVDWTGGRASVGDVDGVKGILEAIRKQRDGD